MQKGFAVGVAQAYPASIEVIRFWAQGLEQKGFALVPVSGVVTAEKMTPPPKPVQAHNETSHGKPRAPAVARPVPAKGKPATNPDAHAGEAHDNTGPHP
jgi:hypothetical protein